ncbi:hypothetical protein D9M68_212040 [compost metagenome]
MPISRSRAAPSTRRRFSLNGDDGAVEGKHGAARLVGLPKPSSSAKRKSGSERGTPEENCFGRYEQSVADDRQSLALYVADGQGRSQAPGHLGNGHSDHRQGRSDPRSLFLQVGNRCAERQAGCLGFPASVPHRRGDAGARLQSRALAAGRLEPASRCAVCKRWPTRGSPTCLQDLCPHAPALAALPSGAAHRWAFARHRARHQGHRDDRPIHDPEQRADPDRISADGGDLLVGLRFQLSVCDGRHRLAVHLVHGQGERLAHRHSPLDERQRHRRQHQGDRLAPELRDGQIFRQRRDGSPSLRQVDGAL